MAKRTVINKLNDLAPKEWLKFQKSWFIHNPPPRQKNVLRHPAKFPETLAMEFIRFFTKAGGAVLDPMAGTGSALVAALRVGRNAYGIELNPGYAELARQVIEDERTSLGESVRGLRSELVTGDAKDLEQIVQANNFPIIDYVITSPPYWDMLHSNGADTQRERRSDGSLDVFYSDDPRDLGNIAEYDTFVQHLAEIYIRMKTVLKPGAYLTIIVKNVKKGGRIYPLAWDLSGALKDAYTRKDEKIWCQDNQRLSPFGMGNVWVSNTFHHYCLQFRHE